jgi:RNA polymerase sigma factor (sigma-70 family)
MTGEWDSSMFGEADLNALYQYAIALCHQRDDAYDLLQSALEKYLVELKCKRHSIDNPMAFVRTLIRNLHIDQYRYQQRWDTEQFEEYAPYDITPVDLDQICIDAETLQRVWSMLSVQDRDILYQWAVLGYTTDEVCKRIGMPRGTFLSRIHRLRNKMQAQRDSLQAQEGV